MDKRLLLTLICGGALVGVAVAGGAPPEDKANGAREIRPTGNSDTADAGRKLAASISKLQRVAVELADGGWLTLSKRLLKLVADLQADSRSQGGSLASSLVERIHAFREHLPKMERMWRSGGKTEKADVLSRQYDAMSEPLKLLKSIAGTHAPSSGLSRGTVHGLMVCVRGGSWAKLTPSEVTKLLGIKPNVPVFITGPNDKPPDCIGLILDILPGVAKVTPFSKTFNTTIWVNDAPKAKSRTVSWKDVRMTVPWRLRLTEKAGTLGVPLVNDTVSASAKGGTLEITTESFDPDYGGGSRKRYKWSYSKLSVSERKAWTFRKALTYIKLRKSAVPVLTKILESKTTTDGRRFTATRALMKIDPQAAISAARPRDIAAIVAGNKRQAAQAEERRVVQTIELMEQFVAILKTVKDKESAIKANPKLNAVAVKMKKIKLQGKTSNKALIAKYKARGERAAKGIKSELLRVSKLDVKMDK